jgi:hypothetical protein
MLFERKYVIRLMGFTLKENVISKKFAIRLMEFT